MENVRRLPVEGADEGRVGLDELAREGARRMIAAALEAEVDEYVSAFVDEVDEHGHRVVVRNGRARERKLTFGSGTVPIRAPRVNDKRVDPATGERRKFSSKILPAYARRSPKVTEVLPVLYLHGLSTAMDKLDRDWKQLTAFYAFPAEHWRHLRTTNTIESSFATVKLRTRVTKGAGSKKAALGMAFELLQTAEERWRRFNGHELVADVLAGARFKDGIRVPAEHPDTTDETVAA